MTFQKRLWLSVFAAVVVIVAKSWLRPSGGVTSRNSPVNSLSNTVSALAPASGTTGKPVVVIQTGQERMSNAVRCMSYVLELSHNLPEEQATLRSHLTSMAGVLFFGDCLMAKMSHGYVTVSSNELCQSFSNAVVKVFTNQVPEVLAWQFSQPFPSYDPHDLQKLSAHESWLREHPELGLAHGFYFAFAGHNNRHLTLDEQYAQMATYPELGQSLKAVDKLFQQAGIADAEQSDFKAMCLGLGITRTTAYSTYVPRSAGPQSEAKPEATPLAYRAVSESLDKVLKWRLVNMYGLDDTAAQALVQALSRLPVDGFKGADLQPPAVIK